MAENNTSYGNIFKTTFLFGFVQVYRTIINILKNKLAAILIGPEGIGVLGIYQNVIVLFQTAAGLGVNQSAIRDISEAKGADNHNKLSYIINVVNKVILCTGLLGCIVTLVFSYCLSNWTFGDKVHTIAYCIISLVVALNIVDEAKQAILKGMRQLRMLAKASMIGATMGLIITIPLYFFFGKDGIVPSLLIASIVAVLVSNYFVEKIDYEKLDLSFAEIIKSATPMVKMGIALMTVTLLQYIVSLVIIAYIRYKGGLDDVGIYNAGNVIINGYFGMIITALTTDYYPRIAAVNHDNNALQEELNKQSLVTLVLTCPMFVFFMTLLPLFIQMLYTSDFLPAVQFVKWSIYFTLITIVSNQIDMILIAKFNSKTILTLSVVMRLVQVILSIVLYSAYGLEGLGITYLILGVLHMIMMAGTMQYLYKIHLSKKFFKLAAVVLLFAVSSSTIQTYLNGHMYYGLSIILILISLWFSLYVAKRSLGIDFIKIINIKIYK